MSNLRRVGGVLVPRLGDEGSVSIKDYIMKNADIRFLRMMKRRDLMIKKNTEELNERIDAYKQSLAFSKARYD